jgi:hypothetical protein
MKVITSGMILRQLDVAGRRPDVDVQLGVPVADEEGDEDHRLGQDEPAHRAVGKAFALAHRLAGPAGDAGDDHRHASPSARIAAKAVVVHELEGKRDGQEQDAEADDEGIDARIPVGVGVSFGVMGVVRHCLSLVFACSRRGRRGKILRDGCQLRNVKT